MPFYGGSVGGGYAAGLEANARVNLEQQQLAQMMYALQQQKAQQAAQTPMGLSVYDLAQWRMNQLNQPQVPVPTGVIPPGASPQAAPVPGPTPQPDASAQMGPQGSITPPGYAPPPPDYSGGAGVQVAPMQAQPPIQGTPLPDQPGPYRPYQAFKYQTQEDKPEPVWTEKDVSVRQTGGGEGGTGSFITTPAPKVGGTEEAVGGQTMPGVAGATAPAPSAAAFPGAAPAPSAAGLPQGGQYPPLMQDRESLMLIQFMKKRGVPPDQVINMLNSYAPHQALEYRAAIAGQAAALRAYEDVMIKRPNVQSQIERRESQTEGEAAKRIETRRYHDMLADRFDKQNTLNEKKLDELKKRGAEHKLANDPDWQVASKEFAAAVGDYRAIGRSLATPNLDQKQMEALKQVERDALKRVQDAQDNLESFKTSDTRSTRKEAATVLPRSGAPGAVMKFDPATGTFK